MWSENRRRPQLASRSAGVGCRLVALTCLFDLVLGLPLAAAGPKTAVLTRGYDVARAGANTGETELTPDNVKQRKLRRLFSVSVDDPRIEAQPLIVPDLMIKGALHDVLYVCTMDNTVWAFDASNGTKLWDQPVSLGPPIKPKLVNDPDHPLHSEID
jgi:hypothetical protein